MAQETGKVHNQNGKILTDMLRAARTSSLLIFERFFIQGKNSVSRWLIAGGRRKLSGCKQASFSFRATAECSAKVTDIFSGSGFGSTLPNPL
jgi:hypothetical protein